MLGGCQSTRTAKNVSVNSFQTGLAAWLLLVCVCAWHELPCEEHRLLLSPCHTTAANQGPDMKEVWAHHHLWLAWIGAELRSPVVWLAGTEVGGKSSRFLSFHSCSAAGSDFACTCACVCEYSPCSFVCMRDVFTLRAVVRVSVCLCLCVDWPDLLYSIMHKHWLPHLARNTAEKLRSAFMPVFMRGESP